MKPRIKVKFNELPQTLEAHAYMKLLQDRFEEFSDAVERALIRAHDELMILGTVSQERIDEISRQELHKLIESNEDSQQEGE